MSEPTTPRHAPALDDGDDQETYRTCGAVMVWVDCFALGCEDGEVNRYSLYPLDYGSEDEAWEICHECNGKGGFWVCPTQMSD